MGYAFTFACRVVREYLADHARALNALQDLGVVSKQRLFSELVRRFQFDQRAWNRAKKVINSLDACNMEELKPFGSELGHYWTAICQEADPELLRKLNNVFVVEAETRLDRLGRLK